MNVIKRVTHLFKEKSCHPRGDDSSGEPHFQFFVLDKYPLNSRVFFKDNGPYNDGIVAWTGYKEDQACVVIELDNDSNEATDGSFSGERLVELEEDARQRYVMRFLCHGGIDKQNKPLKKGDCCHVISKFRNNLPPTLKQLPKKFVLHRRDEHHEVWEALPTDMNFTISDSQLRSSFFRVPSHLLEAILPPVNDEVSYPVPPISGQRVDYFFGFNKGIQGSMNSCYIDTLLFALFACSDVMDEFVEKAEVIEARSCLLHSIIYPLRSFHYVSKDHVDYLRRQISRTTNNDKFEMDARDIPETMDALFAKYLQITPPVIMGFDGRDEGYDVFSTQTSPHDLIQVPTFQQLLEYSSLKTSFGYKALPKFLMLELPRDASTTQLFIPSLELDLGNLIDKRPKACSVCGNEAVYQDKEPPNYTLADSFLCWGCAQQRLDTEDTRRCRRLRTAPFDANQPPAYLSLSALICIDGQHYSCFVRTKCDRWLFFDSMSRSEFLSDELCQRQKVQIPCVEEVPDFATWIEAANIQAKDSQTLDQFAGQPGHERRIFGCACAAIYCEFLE